MNRTIRSVLSSEEGKFEPVIIAVSTAGIVSWIIGKYTGYKVFVFTLSSGIKRMSIGLFCIYGARFFPKEFPDRFSLGDFGELILVTSLFTCWILGFVLIPLGLIQVLGSIITKKRGRLNNKESG